MSEEDGGITPTRPTPGYAPKTSDVSRDRDADGTSVLPGRPNLNRRKKKKPKTTPPKQPEQKEESPEDSEAENKVDIRARSIRIETYEPDDTAKFAAQCTLSARGAPEHLPAYGT